MVRLALSLVSAAIAAAAMPAVFAAPAHGDGAAAEKQWWRWSGHAHHDLHSWSWNHPSHSATFSFPQPTDSASLPSSLASLPSSIAASFTSSFPLQTFTSVPAPPSTFSASRPGSSAPAAPSSFSASLPDASASVSFPAEPSASSTPLPSSSASALPTTLLTTVTTAAPTSTLVASTSSAPVATASLGATQQEWLTQHNTVRAQHGAADLVWSTTLEAAAQTWADKCTWAHSQGTVGAYGENLFLGSGTTWTPTQVASDWVAEASQYDPANPTYSHFTQVVWKGTTEVGCAIAYCDSIMAGWGTSSFMVCEYNKPGNVLGEFAENVQV